MEMKEVQIIDLSEHAGHFCMVSGAYDFAVEPGSSKVRNTFIRGGPEGTIRSQIPWTGSYSLGGIMAGWINSADPCRYFEGKVDKIYVPATSD